MVRGKERDIWKKSTYTEIRKQKTVGIESVSDQVGINDPYRRGRNTLRTGQTKSCQTKVVKVPVFSHTWLVIPVNELPI